MADVVYKVNFAGVAAPGVGDDSASGYSVGSVIYDVVGLEVYDCLGASVGMAVWKQRTGGVAVEDIDTFAAMDAIVADESLVSAAGAFHDGFSDFVADEHVAHTGVEITLAATTNETTVAEGAQDISASRTFTIGIADDAVLPGTGAVTIAKGTTAQEPAAVNGMLRYNETTDKVMAVEDGAFVNLGGAWNDSVDPVTLYTTTKDVVVGVAQINTAKFSIDGDTDQVMVALSGHSTQTNNFLDCENSAGVLQSSILSDGTYTGKTGDGSNDAGGNCVIAGGRPTGTGDPGHLLLQVAIADTGVSTTVNDLSTVIEIDANTTVTMLGFFGVSPVIQPATTGESVGFTAGSGTSANDDSTFTGNVGSSAYTVSDIVKALKNLGLMDL